MMALPARDGSWTLEDDAMAATAILASDVASEVERRGFVVDSELHDDVQKTLEPPEMMGSSNHAEGRGASLRTVASDAQRLRVELAALRALVCESKLETSNWIKRAARAVAKRAARVAGSVHNNSSSGTTTTTAQERAGEPTALSAGSDVFLLGAVSEPNSLLGTPHAPSLSAPSRSIGTVANDNRLGSAGTLRPPHGEATAQQQIQERPVTQPQPGHNQNAAQHPRENPHAPGPHVSVPSASAPLLHVVPALAAGLAPFSARREEALQALKEHAQRASVFSDDHGGGGETIPRQLLFGPPPPPLHPRPPPPHQQPPLFTGNRPATSSNTAANSRSDVVLTMARYEAVPTEKIYHSWAIPNSVRNVVLEEFAQRRQPPSPPQQGGEAALAVTASGVAMHSSRPLDKSRNPPPQLLHFSEQRSRVSDTASVGTPLQRSPTENSLYRLVEDSHGSSHPHAHHGNAFATAVSNATSPHATCKIEPLAPLLGHSVLQSQGSLRRSSASGVAGSSKPRAAAGFAPAGSLRLKKGLAMTTSLAAQQPQQPNVVVPGGPSTATGAEWSAQKKESMTVRGGTIGALASSAHGAVSGRTVAT